MPDDTETTAPKARVTMRRKKDGRVVSVPQGAVEFRKALGYEVQKSTVKKEA